MPYNLAAPNGIAEPVNVSNLQSWFEKELTQVPNEAERSVLEAVANNLDCFIKWATEALLLWPECDRIPPAGKKQKYHSYLAHIRQLAAAQDVQLDTRPNGPAIAHPIADAMADEFPFFAWLLRGHASRRFGYDPDGVFSPQRNEYGFCVGRSCRVVQNISEDRLAPRGGLDAAREIVNTR